MKHCCRMYPEWLFFPCHKIYVCAFLFWCHWFVCGLEGHQTDWKSFLSLNISCRSLPAGEEIVLFTSCSNKCCKKKQCRKWCYFHLLVKAESEQKEDWLTFPCVSTHNILYVHTNPHWFVRALQSMTNTLLAEDI